MKNIEKRKRVMERSIRLGHCICDPRKPCPCDLLKEKDVCLCAGERPAVSDEPVRLTQLVEYAGCASKIDQGALKEVLGGLSFPSDPRVLVGVPAGDDAGVFHMASDQAWVQTVDVFTPSVDDPYLFGQIAAANSVSDIYAMGAKPLTALSILGFPIRTVPDYVMRDILRGGIDKMTEAGVAIIGGHSINDKEIKAGFAVTGVVDPKKIMANAGVRAGDVLILTKPLGTGILAFAAQINRARPEWMQAAARSMASLNKTAAEIMQARGAHACTDITGFGLVGHVGNMALASQVDIEIIWDDLPVLDGVLECAAAGIASGGVERNRESSQSCLVVGDQVTSAMLDICFDPQTSGGLLIAVPEKRAGEMLDDLHAKGIIDATVIGRAVRPGDGKVFIKTTQKRTFSVKKDATMESKTTDCCCGNTANSSCCGNKSQTADSTVSETQKKFQDFLKTANTPGALDAHTKQAIAIALSVQAKCEPCVKIHIQKARDMGFSQAEIDEAAWMAIGFGGSPLMMFYNQVRGVD